MKRGLILLFAGIFSVAVAKAAAAQSSQTPSSGDVAQQFKNGGTSLGHGISQGATQIGHGFKNGAILTWDAMKNGAHSIGNTFSGNNSGANGQSQ